jgi:hypothetical protein
MEVTTEKFIRKPLYVDAVRVKADNFDEMVAWCDGEVQTEEVQGTGTIKKFIKVRVHNPKNPRQTKAFIGDWLLYTDRGYKVYTNKAFRAAFDLVPKDGSAPIPQTPVVDERVGSQRIPKFYIDPATGGLVETPPDADMKPLSFNELMTIIRNELVGNEGVEAEPQLATADEIREKLPNVQDRRPKEPQEEPGSLYRTLSEEVESVSDERLTGDPAVDTHAEATTPQGEPIEVVPATPETIAEVVREQEKAREVGEGLKVADTPTAPPVEPVTPSEVAPQPQPVPEQAPQEAAAGKYVLSKKEQADLGPEEVRELIASGEAVLEQDLAESA